MSDSIPPPYGLLDPGEVRIGLNVETVLELFPEFGRIIEQIDAIRLPLYDPDTGQCDRCGATIGQFDCTDDRRMGAPRKVHDEWHRQLTIAIHFNAWMSQAVLVALAALAAEEPLRTAHEWDAELEDELGGRMFGFDVTGGIVLEDRITKEDFLARRIAPASPPHKDDHIHLVLAGYDHTVVTDAPPLGLHVHDRLSYESDGLLADVVEHAEQAGAWSERVGAPLPLVVQVCCVDYGLITHVLLLPRHRHQSSDPMPWRRRVRAGTAPSPQGAGVPPRPPAGRR